MSAQTMDKYYNDIIDNMRLILQTQENRIHKLQESEYKLETEISSLQKELKEVRSQKKIINSPNHTLFCKPVKVQVFPSSH